MLSLRRASVQDVERIAAYAREMSSFLMESEFTETKAFVRSFVKQALRHRSPCGGVVGAADEQAVAVGGKPGVAVGWSGLAISSSPDGRPSTDSPLMYDRDAIPARPRQRLHTLQGHIATILL